MSAINIIILIILSIAGLIILKAALTSKQSFAEQSETINCSVQTVYDYIKYLKNHENFSVWTMMDPDLKKEYRGIDGTVGSVFRWQSNKSKNVGTGEQEIKQLNAGKSIEFELRFIKPFQFVSIATMKTEAVSENQTKIYWSIKSDMNFIMRISKGMIEKALNDNLKQGLSNLKKILEKD